MGKIKLFNWAIGAIGGMLSNYLWEKIQLPGYGAIAFPIGKRDDGEWLDMGYDDLANIGVGGLIVAKKETRHIGIGWILGALATKLLEKKGYFVHAARRPTQPDGQPSENGYDIDPYGLWPGLTPPS